MLLKPSKQNYPVLQPFCTTRLIGAATLLVCIFSMVSCGTQAQDVVDATSLNYKVMAGYQGWFRTPGDNPNNTDQGWSHLFGRNFRPGFAYWPDMSELTPGEKHAVPGFTKPDGSQAYLYSAQNPKTVLRHFQWMKQYGIDGVWLSEFCDHFPGGRQQADSTTVYTIMNNVRAAARATGRTWAFMWDMSGFGRRTSKSEVFSVIVDNWKKMVDEGVTSDPRYLHQNGKPVLLLWGFFPDRPASQPDYMNPIVDFLQAPGKYQAALVAGVDPVWRERGTPEFQAMLMRMTALQPWSVGRRITDPATGYAIQNTTLWAGDIAKCKANNVIFIPVFNSGTNIAGPPPAPPKGPTVPRRMGNYLWEQFVAASKTGVINSAFVAMFDEINEGTQIMKTDNHPPVQYPFLTYNGATSDYYLRLTGVGAEMLKSGKPISPVIPISPFSTKKSYFIKNRANGLYLHNKGRRAGYADQAASVQAEWQILFDHDGCFIIRDRQTGKVLSATGGTGKPVALAGNTNSDNVKWHMVWDGSGDCRIVSKTGGLALTASGGQTAGAPVKLVADTTNAQNLRAPETDYLRWQIIEQ